MTTAPFRLSDALDFFEDSDAFTFGLAEGENGGDEKDLIFLDDSGLSSRSPDSFFACGYEHGATHLIHARSFEAAWEAWVDELPTIPASELIEAYGIVDDYRDEYEKIDPAPAWGPGGAGSPEWNAWHARFAAACHVELQRRDAAAREGKNDYPELIEGYEMQSNCSGTGIVDMSYYAWMREVDPSDIVIARRPVAAKKEDAGR